MTVTEIRQKRATLVQQMRALVTASEGRAMTDQESAQWDAADLQQGRLGEQLRGLDPEHAPRRTYATDRAGRCYRRRTRGRRSPRARLRRRRRR